MLHSGVLLPFKVYLGGLGKWTNVTFNAFNFYAAIGLNNVSDATPLFGNFTLAMLTTVITILLIAGILLLFFKVPKKCPWIFAFLIMETLFLFGGRMHERYQVPVLIFLLIAAVRHRSGRLFGSFVGITVICFFNQFLLFDYICTFQKTAWAPYYDNMAVIISVINLIVFCLTFVFCYQILKIPAKASDVITEAKSNAVSE